MKITKRIALLGTVSLLCFVLAFTAGAISRTLIGNLSTQHAAERWAGASDNRFAQITAFFPEFAQISSPNINQAVGAIRQSLIADGFAPDFGDFRFGYSAESTLRITNERHSTPGILVRAIGVGGNFFDFHNVQLISGAYFVLDEINRDVILIEEELAWTLFGATDVAGMEIAINGMPHIIVGVFRPGEDFATSRAADGGLYRVFLPSDRLFELTFPQPVTSFQVILPEPIRGRAEQLFAESLNELGGDDIKLLNNSERFCLPARWAVLRDFGVRSMQTDGFRFPYWENAARMTEDYVALLWLVSLLLLIFPFVQGIRLSVWAWKRRKWMRFSTVHGMVDGRIEQKRELDWNIQQAKKHHTAQSIQAQKLDSSPKEEIPIVADMGENVGNIVREILENEEF